MLWELQTETVMRGCFPGISSMVKQSRWPWAIPPRFTFPRNIMKVKRNLSKQSKTKYSTVQESSRGSPSPQNDSILTQIYRDLTLIVCYVKKWSTFEFLISWVHDSRVFQYTKLAPGLIRYPIWSLGILFGPYLPYLAFWEWNKSRRIVHWYRLGTLYDKTQMCASGF